MTETATSPRLHSYSRSSRPTTSTTPSSRPPSYAPSVGQNMPPLLSSQRISTPHNNITTDAKTPSPNYFGFQSNDGGNAFLTGSRQNWSPPSSAVRSTAAISPSVIPLEQDPTFDAFRRQSEGKAFNLGGLGNNFKMTSPPNTKTKSGRRPSRPSPPRDSAQHMHSQSLDPNIVDMARSPKRMLSPGSMIMPEGERRGSPASFAHSEPEGMSRDSTQEGQARFALPLDNRHGPNGFPKHRAETLPAIKDPEAAVMVTPQHVASLLESHTEEMLLLDLRVATQYAQSHITGSLNLCIPTTLLKRPSFNVQKLVDTFKDGEQRQKIENWRNSSHIIVYDARSSLLKDAHTCVNTIKKFRTEGYDGSLYVVRGGFAEFASRFPSYVENGSGYSNTEVASKLLVSTERPEVAPVAGGCPMPSTDKPANPFFGNIRQNMDLIGGVGQIPLKHPASASEVTERVFPEWIRQAADDSDQGKNVSKKFEQIERQEKRRMEEALSGKVSFGTPAGHSPSKTVQIAGIEKGGKNRYNNIWPFEHSRVKLQGIPSHGCDYFNANYVKAGWSNKRYISTQAPMPATFNDFWNVVWQQDVRVIIMLTAEKEGAQVKAHNYWDQKQYGPLHLDFLSEKRASIEPARIHRHRPRPPQVKRTATASQLPLAQLDSKEEKTGDQPHVVVRRFTLSHERFPFEPMREVTQLQYSSWPDFGAPAHPAHLLGLVEQCDAVVRSTNRTHSGEPEPPNKRPVLVHCSAGCGRTGTFCTVDSVIDMLKRQRISRRERKSSRMDIDSPPKSAGARKQPDSPSGFFTSASPTRSEGPEGSWVDRDDQDLVEKTVEDFRKQRLSMVQSLRQYVLCYESVMEWLAEQSPKSA